MTREQALNVIRPLGNTLDDLKTAYREACKKYHPDINPNGLELMKVVNVAYEFLKEHFGKWSADQQTNDTSLTEAMQDVFNNIRHFVNIKTEVCGSWLWISGETWRYKKELGKNGLGLKYASKKQMWYWNDGTFRKRGKRVFDMNEIRAKYGSVDLEQEPLSAVS